MSTELILYDLPSKGEKPTCWSYNAWKTRLALNYKTIPYRTSWTEYPSIAPQARTFGIEPNPSVSSTGFSIPIARFPDGKYIMNSLQIAHELEKFQPEPSLRLENGYVQPTTESVNLIVRALAPRAVPRVWELLLNPASQPYFHETRTRRFGMALTDVAESLEARDAWENAMPGVERLKALLHENEGPFIAGEEVSYADFILAGLWRFCERLDKDGDMFAKGMSMDESFPKHMEACRKWLARDDH
ncbi:Hypothetical protein R9X50_00435900 [Acrodontium crateriforme]|uniref:GST N-terminal domain-containing protein n=1 Tax=Acrodontium crateriforme TaxID=150365 RepID=A0AAQ3RCP2_9PEZI|nr:Hypothetical protein R9X50_00435900 [Acrodontium crateriforme]